MVQAWFMDNSDADQRLEHKPDPPQYVEIDELRKLSGVLYWKLDPVTYREDGVLDEIKKKRGYTYEDVCEVTKEKMPDYDKKLKMFFEEHLHVDEEIRFILDGSGYFDVRDKNDKWIRIQVETGDLLIVPAGIYHRFTLDTKNYVKAMRLFVGEPVWTPHNRPADDMPIRKEYLQNLERGFVGDIAA